MRFKRELAALTAVCLLGAAAPAQAAEISAPGTEIPIETAEYPTGSEGGSTGSEPSLENEGTGRIPQYMKSVTYFGDEWPINYWNSEDKNMESNMTGIAADGFNSIILVIPWREFQPNQMECHFNETAFSRLDEVMECAERHGLGVVLRVGYTWDYLGPTELPKRYEGVTKKNSADWDAWMQYSQKLYERASAHSNFWGGFITWEDFWAYTDNMGQDVIMKSRIRMAEESGYRAYLEERYSLDEIQAVYGSRVQGFDQVYIPYKDHPAARLFYEFYDWFLLDLLTETQKVFPGLSMEVRADGDVVYDSEAKRSYYSHSDTYSCPGADYTALMYSVSMGQENNNDRISSEQALRTMAFNLDNIYQKAGKPLYIEQLLYMDSTEAFSYNTQIEESQVGDFVANLSPVLSGRTNGYGLWVYRNYVNNAVYNSQFGLEEEGWSFAGNSSVEERNGSRAAVLGKNAVISQDLNGRVPSRGTVCIEFYAEPELENTTVTVQLGDIVETVRITEGKTYELKFPQTSRYPFSITAGKKVWIDDVRVYTYEQNGRIYHRDGTEDALAGDFRTLNSELP